MGLVLHGKFPICHTVPADSRTEVHKDCGCICCERIFMKACPRCSGKTYIDTVIRHLEAVIAWSHDFLCMVEMGIDMNGLGLLSRHVFA